MCGIAGVWDPRGRVDVARLQRMSELLRHRGPDDEGIVLIDARAGRVLTLGGPDTPEQVWASALPYAPGRWWAERGGPQSPVGLPVHVGLMNRRLAIIDLKSGGSLQGVLEGLNRIRQMAVPADHVEGGTMIIPGHGRLCDVADLDIYQQMVTIVRDRLQDMINRGMTLDQVKAARPTLDYDPIYGSATGNWTTNMFIEAAYNSLSMKPDARGSRGK